MPISPNPFKLHPVLKNILAGIPDAEDKPIIIELLCEELHNNEKSVLSCARELINLGLAVEPEDRFFSRSVMGTRFMSLSELEQHLIAKQHPIFHVLDLTGDDKSKK